MLGIEDFYTFWDFDNISKYMGTKSLQNILPSFLGIKVYSHRLKMFSSYLVFPC